MYWFLFADLSLPPEAHVGAVGISDFLFVVLLGDAAQNAMIGQGTIDDRRRGADQTLVIWNWTHRLPELPLPGWSSA